MRITRRGQNNIYKQAGYMCRNLAGGAPLNEVGVADRHKPRIEHSRACRVETVIKQPRYVSNMRDPVKRDRRLRVQATSCGASMGPIDI